MKEVQHTVASVAQATGRPLWQVQSTVYALLKVFPEPVIILDRRDVANFPGSVVLTPQAAHLVIRQLREALTLPFVTPFVAHAHAITGHVRIDVIDTRTIPVKTGEERVDTITLDGAQTLAEFSPEDAITVLNTGGWVLELEALLSPWLMTGWWPHTDTAGKVIAYSAPVSKIDAETINLHTAIIRELLTFADERPTAERQA